MLEFIDTLIDRITMYRLLLYYLVALLAIAAGLSGLGVMHYNPAYIVISALILVTSCIIINKVFAYIFDAPTNNSESSILTALILTLIITPDPTSYNLLFLLAASGLAISSKYLLTIRRKHIFNPAAIAVVLTAIGPRQTASWWIGTAAMLPFVIAGGLLIARKIRRGNMIFAFLISTTIATGLYAVLSHEQLLNSLHQMAVDSPIFFLGFVMLTEPLTSPPTRGKQTWYAVLVGALVPPQAHILHYYTSPEISLVIGNVFSYIVSPKRKLFPILKRKVRIAVNTADFVFDPDQKFSYKPGQYMEWTLPHDHTDSRGNRRYFTLASSPTEKDLIIGVKFYEHGSSFKEALLDIDSDTPIVAAQLAGDFTLPKDPNQKLAFIAGGIGITPFRSMAKYLTDKDEHRSITMLYSARTRESIAYKEVFEAARSRIGFNTAYVLTNASSDTSEPGVVPGPITARLITRQIPDYRERTFYISGTHEMVVSMQKALHELGVERRRIKIDFFPGYA